MARTTLEFPLGARRRRAISSYLLLLIALCAAPSAQAAGGAHVVDDADVETPGACHLETWATSYGAGQGLMNFSPACTPKAWPGVELGASGQRIWDEPDDSTLGPTLKLSLRPTRTGLGLGLSAGGLWSLRSGAFETARLVVPISIPVHDRIRVNLNAGWVYSRASVQRNAGFYGAQVEMLAAENLRLMVEAFGLDHGLPGAQLGLRWTPGGGAVDIDLLAGRRVDGIHHDAVTLGVTVRR